MAVISDLVKLTAEVEGLEENFVSVYARAAREAGHISHFGRGRNAAQMTTHDAACLLIAINASSLAKHVPETIAEYSKLSRKHNQEHSLSDYAADQLGGKGVIFIDALSFLLGCDTMGKPNAERILEEARDPRFDRLPLHLRSSIRVEFEGPQPCARIAVKSIKEEQKDQPPSFRTNADFWYFRNHNEKTPFKQGDRLNTTTITANTLLAVAQLLKS